MQENERYQRGLKRLEEISGETGKRAIATLSETSPDLAQYAVEYAYGDVLSRLGLDLRAREIATMSALAAMGTAFPQLKVHIHAALKVGVTRDEIIEIMIQISVYAGFPAALNGIKVAKEVFDEIEEEK